MHGAGEQTNLCLQPPNTKTFNLISSPSSSQSLNTQSLMYSSIQVIDLPESPRVRLCKTVGKLRGAFTVVSMRRAEVKRSAHGPADEKEQTGRPRRERCDPSSAGTADGEGGDTAPSDPERDRRLDSAPTGRKQRTSRVGSSWQHNRAAMGRRCTSERGQQSCLCRSVSLQTGCERNKLQGVPQYGSAEEPQRFHACADGQWPSPNQWGLRQQTLGTGLAVAEQRGKGSCIVDIERPCKLAKRQKPV